MHADGVHQGFFVHQLPLLLRNGTNGGIPRSIRDPPVRSFNYLQLVKIFIILELVKLLYNVIWGRGC